MSKSLIVLLSVLVIGSWFLLGEKRSFWEKLIMAATIAGVYIALRLMQGQSLEQVLTPILY